MVKERKKTWEMKVDLVLGSFNRAKDKSSFAKDFYENLFFLNPNIKKYFLKTDFEHQTKALMTGLQFLIEFLDHSNENARIQVIRLSHTHAKSGLNIHPHDYYYWIEALIMTFKKHDPSWYQDLEYYWREVISYPVTFMISQYFLKEQSST
jgi:hemoglobin-like flavoprotein